MAITLPLEIGMLLFRTCQYISPKAFSRILRGKILTKITAVIIIPHNFIYLSLPNTKHCHPDAFIGLDYVWIWDGLLAN